MRATTRPGAEKDAAPVMASQWGSIGLEQVPEKQGDICWSIGVDDWTSLVFYCDEVWEADDGEGGPFPRKKAGDNPRFARRGDLLRRYNERLLALVDEAREEARLLELYEGT